MGWAGGRVCEFKVDPKRRSETGTLGSTPLPEGASETVWTGREGVEGAEPVGRGQVDPQSGEEVDVEGRGGWREGSTDAVCARRNRSRRDGEPTRR